MNKQTGKWKFNYDYLRLFTIEQKLLQQDSESFTYKTIIEATSTQQTIEDENIQIEKEGECIQFYKYQFETIQHQENNNNKQK